MDIFDRTNREGKPVKFAGFPLGPYQTNCYLIWYPHPDQDDAPAKGWLADAGANPEPILDTIGAEHITLDPIVLTHAHHDHIAGLDQVRRACSPSQVLIHEAERAFLEDPVLNLSAFGVQQVSTLPATGTLEPGTKIRLCDDDWQILFTPGHSPGSVTLYQQDLGVAIVGDALFAGSIGRTDFPTSDHDALIKAIQTHLYTLPDETIVLPGHGPSTTIGREKRTNPFVRG